MALDLTQVPDTFYRVSAKALIFDSANRLLVFMDEKGNWEIPGGGWNHDESFEDCLRRELMEEMKIEPVTIGDVRCVYKCQHYKGYYKLCIAAPVEIQAEEFVPSGDSLVEARFVTKAELLELPFQESELGVKDCADKIWSE